MTLSSWALLALVWGLFAFDAVTLGRGARRLLLVEATLFAVGGFFIASPDTATLLAHRVGIGRGVDFVLYPVVIWLVRESLVNRHHRWEERERMSELIRGLAIERATLAERSGNDATAASIAPDAPDASAAQGTVAGDGDGEGATTADPSSGS